MEQVSQRRASIHPIGAEAFKGSIKGQSRVRLQFVCILGKFVPQSGFSAFLRSTLQVIRTMACEYALCSLFVPGDRQIIIGTKVRQPSARRHTVHSLSRKIRALNGRRLIEI